LRIYQEKLLKTAELAEIISLIKSTKQDGILSQLFSNVPVLNGIFTHIDWKAMIMDSNKEILDEEQLNQMLTTYDSENMRFKPDSQLNEHMRKKTS